MWAEVVAVVNIDRSMSIYFFRKIAESRLLRQMAELRGLFSVTCKLIRNTKNEYVLQVKSSIFSRRGDEAEASS